MVDAPADPVFDMLATIAVSQGASADEVACGFDGCDYFLAVGRRTSLLGSFILEQGVWPELLASAMAANANELPAGTDLGAYARAYEEGTAAAAHG